MCNITTLHVSEAVTRQRSIAADLLAQSEDTLQKAAKYGECFANVEAIIASLNGAKRHAYRIRFRALQSELKAAIDELVALQQELLDVRQGLARQAIAPQRESSAAVR